MSRRASTLDRLIAESKQATSDLMALRHEIERVGLRRARYLGGPADRAYLVCSNLRSLADDVHKLWEQATNLADADEDEPAAPINRPMRAIGDGTLRLTAGGR
jgi:hypothetical protein